MNKLTRILKEPKILSILAAGIGQIFMMGAMAVVSRLYNGEQLSEYGVFFSLVNLLQLLVTLRLEQGIIYEKTDRDVAELVAATLLTVVPLVLVSAAGGYVYLALNPQTTMRADTLTLLMAGSVLFSAIARIFIQIAARLDKFHLLALVSFSRPSLIALLQLIVLAFGIGFCKLPAAYLLSQMFLSLFVFMQMRDAFSFKSLAKHINGIRGAIARNKKFIIFNLPQNLIFVLSESLVPLSLSFLFPKGDSVALFWLASRAVFAPATVIAESIRSMVYRTAAKKEKAHLFSYIVKNSSFLAFAMSIPVLILIIAGTDIFELVFGAEWGRANDFAIILGVLAIINIAFLPVVGALPLLDMQGTYLIFELLGLIVRAFLLYAFNWQSPIEAVLFGTVAYAVILLAFFCLTLRAALRCKREKPIPSLNPLF